ncbi:DUF1223 domain-containing protein [Silvimonas sp.]|uniref:DUF1223 domain-containing protein n=1 Tax=Silvimonas sp. TaxID=2650811 RepID=UPI00284270D1|nr:DUF1223 domain-containing protein [Silvimonas sp.]MDR3429743.1 DUF1223 domain-containing protein [Silvimonas sp.]
MRASCPSRSNAIFKTLSATLVLLLAALAPMQALAAAVACTAQSSPHRAALVQLFTSEGCSDCPPADQRLNTLGNAPMASNSAQQVIPLALHVNYWDNLGWRDPFAQPEFGDLQSWMVDVTGGHVVYTPHFFVNGTPYLDWRSKLDAVFGQTFSQSAPASVQLQVQALGNNQLSVHTVVSAIKTAKPTEPLQLRLAVTEGNLVSHVQAGENGGVTLNHAHVTRVLSPPIALSDQGASIQTTLSLPPATGKIVRVVAYVQNSKTAEVLQAVTTADCAR